MYRISKLLKIDRKLFHTNDLAILWNIQNRQHLYTIIARYMKKEILYPVYKGLYSVVPIQELDPFELGRSVIHSYAYISTETVLSQNGVISQAVFDYTFVADKSKKIKIGKWVFRYRQMRAEFLHHPAGIMDQNGKFFATTERAVADMLYYNPHYHFDVAELIDFERARSIQKEVGYARVRA